MFDKGHIISCNMIRVIKQKKMNHWSEQSNIHSIVRSVDSIAGWTYSVSDDKARYLIAFQTTRHNVYTVSVYASEHNAVGKSVIVRSSWSFPFLLQRKLIRHKYSIGICLSLTLKCIRESPFPLLASFDQNIKICPFLFCNYLNIVPLTENML